MASEGENITIDITLFLHCNFISDMLYQNLLDLIYSAAVWISKTIM